MKKTETLWVYLPETEQQAINRVIHTIEEKKLGSCSVEELLYKSRYNKTGDWEQALTVYNDILPRKIKMTTEDMQFKVKKLREQFIEKHQPSLNAQNFKPNELLALMILCYSDPLSISPELCSALKENNSNDIRKEIIYNSDYVRRISKTRARRMTSETSNLRLLNYALYANDSSVQLTDEIKDKIIADAAKKNITVVIATDQPILVEDLNNFIEVPILSNHTVLPGKNNLLIGISNWDQLGNVSILRNIVSFLQDQKLAFNIFSTNKSLPVLEGQTVNEENSEICDCFGPMDEDFLRLISASDLKNEKQIHNVSDKVNNVTTMDPDAVNERLTVAEQIERANQNRPNYEIQPLDNIKEVSSNNTRVTRETHAYSTATAIDHYPSNAFVSVLVALHMFNKVPWIGSILRNLRQDIVAGVDTVAHYTGSFFSPPRVVVNPTEKNVVEQNTTFNSRMS